jgi:acetolactate synthase I/II/III large subunit
VCVCVCVCVCVQIINVVEMMKPITKYTKQIVSAYNIPSAVREGMSITACRLRPSARVG